MTLIDEPLPGVKILRPFVFEDARGNFVKPFHEDQLAAHGISMIVREEFFSTSAKDVLRGMHFQIPPHDHQKLIYCLSGRVLDVLLDLRKESPTYGKAASFELSAANHHVVHVPRGFAHGFLSLEDGSCMVYKTDAVHAADADKGLLWNSFGFEWPITDAIISGRDLAHPEFGSYASPF
ncbi:dTDP-4-dehydrorhamnose 3,5-epimerase family protein [Luteolibacter ambystomatis]|uniref:dTDP-4-dehydrorhamnose 3,5-epimerase n=1 Tax=Luteolibacter ambystomatis TaxID=2824561 RepID=A0A975IYU0_9BACT|nr:dTDP-4-dehydrorhamnose 3,5-epimerase family protein [Luteolibacter ambystomatis]QUE50233.1 dTDP-4-dehydrorhamnose 3,5-epimerase family protein [Luteolibacter ambystomatis]